MNPEVAAAEDKHTQPDEAHDADVQKNSKNGHLRVILGNYLYAGTLLVGLAASIVAFAAQIAVTKIEGRGTVGVLWFAIFLQLALVLGVLGAILDTPQPETVNDPGCEGSFIDMEGTTGHQELGLPAREYRLQLTATSAAALVLAALGVEGNVYLAYTNPARASLAVGWLLLAMVDCVWLITCGAENGTAIARIVDAFSRVADVDVDVERVRPKTRLDTKAGARGRSSSTPGVRGAQRPSAGGTRPISDVRSRLRLDPPQRASNGTDEHKLDGTRADDLSTSSNGSPVVTSFSNRDRDWATAIGLGLGNHRIVDRTQPGEEVSLDVEEMHIGNGNDSPRLHMSLPPPPASMTRNRRAMYVEEHRQLSTIYDDDDRDHHPDIDALEGSNSDEGEIPGRREAFPYTVRAKSDWIPRTPSEISFRQGDLMQSAEKDGKKWWQVRKADGSVGSAPSNYLKVLV
ncbi:hypothetical protein C8F01DRAFT_1252584 [Mycena amicta]|nr:hypothetical protein C8F01DRAFT_1252584 [Mycena amicta]